MLTTQEEIYIGRVSAVLISNKIASGSREGGMIDKRWPHLIYAVTEALQELYDLEPDNTTDLDIIGNYLISLCFEQSRAQALLNISGGGTTTDTATSNPMPNPYDWRVGTITTSDAPLKEGDTTITLDGTNGTRDFRGYNIEFFRGSQPDYTTNPGDGSVFYSWNRILGLFTLLNGAAQLDEPMRISPVLGVATETQTSDPTTITYNLTTVTEIPNPTNNNEAIRIIIVPNGYSYTWASDFVFGVNWPEQRGMYAVDTIQIYDFAKINSKWLCVGQSLDNPT